MYVFIFVYAFIIYHLRVFEFVFFIVRYRMRLSSIFKPIYKQKETRTNSFLTASRVHYKPFLVSLNICKINLMNVLSRQQEKEGYVSFFIKLKKATFFFIVMCLLINNCSTDSRQRRTLILVIVCKWHLKLAYCACSYS